MEHLIRRIAKKDGDGRTGRLLMNLVLIRDGYPPVSVRPEDRAAYLDALQHADAGHGTTAFERLLYERLDETLADYVRAAKEALSASGMASSPDPP